MNTHEHKSEKVNGALINLLPPGNTIPYDLKVNENFTKIMKELDVMEYLKKNESLVDRTLWAIENAGVEGIIDTLKKYSEEFKKNLGVKYISSTLHVYTDIVEMHRMVKLYLKLYDRERRYTGNVFQTLTMIPDQLPTHPEVKKHSMPDMFNRRNIAAYMLMYVACIAEKELEMDGGRAEITR